MTHTQAFYDSLAPMYHLIFVDWEAAIDRQARVIAKLVKAKCGPTETVLDVSCGIGTQSLGLAALGLKVTASDLSPIEVERAKTEAVTRGLQVNFSVADMRQAYTHHRSQFDLVISFDNSLPHLLTDSDIEQALLQFWQSTRLGGFCMISLRDYARENVEERQLKPYGIKVEKDLRWIGWQVWDPIPPHYQVSMYLVRDDGSNNCQTHVMRTTYNPITTDFLRDKMKEAGFSEVERIDDCFYQPILCGRRPTAEQGGQPDAFSAGYL